MDYDELDVMRDEYDAHYQRLVGFVSDGLISASEFDSRLNQLKYTYSKEVSYEGN